MTRTRTQWAKRLNAAWHELRKTAVEGFAQLGKDIAQAKEELGHGGFMEMVERDLDMSHAVATALMRVSVFIESAVIDSTLLPPDFNTVDRVAALHRRHPETFRALVEDGTISPKLQRNEVSKILRLERVAADEQRVLTLVPIVGKFRTIVIDPAWDYDWLSIAARAKPGYAMQSPEELHALDVKAWADDEVGCQLYCWTTNNFMAEACKLVAHWGFQHRTLITWVKPPPFGLGSYFRNSTEHVLFATLGDTTTRHAAASIPTHFEAPRGEHSEKPEKFYEIVRAASYPPYGEANQRKPRPDFVNLFASIAQEAAE